MNKVRYVALNRAEGPSSECYAVLVVEQGQDAGAVAAAIQDQRHMKGARVVEVGPGCIEAAVLDKLRAWGSSAPKQGEGYDKVDFEVGWEGGQVYQGRFDMNKGGVDGHGLFWTSLVRRLEYYSCRRRPGHFKDDHWEHHVGQMKEHGWDAECAGILDGCAVGS